ncbi:nitrogen fixation protein NifX [Zymomonas mobilis]|uniref:Nitrogen fixation protein NifX n=1 Tax=Zymomonas mobilis subsp. pomaceae (strain ATCC 29192 / DSM 22645 / JCM 10191 / CCUG 17912 / NBRC 13757 / NCIMB 11200 / NRRL B-4491 / Barker I) TaxID=579138 RepID=F8EUQ1_ZYMMT|nr:nitrogen fixation protein NifX [Zymomonas mobilis]AEI38197.1 nitrogen fixation protein NifX [Zymomonas mobilis subsp. pomaceae ATCC 29192]MDX5947887.1 nitrogen fixation protein NifX [Zymomonas mobilis subsp. pomaceae]GEB89949.1 nitrogen fixation protein NifX [Zymomonas mobilis subsp. pomaceae]
MPERRLQLIDSDAPEGSAVTAEVVPTLRIAIATQDMQSLNAHFGGASRFAVWDVTVDDARFVEALGFNSTSDQSGSHKTEGEDKIGPKVEALAGCNLLFILAIGGPAAAKVVSAGIHPIKLPAAESIPSIIERVQTMMKGNPPPWLRKAMGMASPQRSMDFLDDDDE